MLGFTDDFMRQVKEILGENNKIFTVTYTCVFLVSLFAKPRSKYSTTENHVVLNILIDQRNNKQCPGIYNSPL